MFRIPAIYTLMPRGQSETINGLVTGKNYYHYFSFTAGEEEG
jgi:hypothetical protein